MHTQNLHLYEPHIFDIEENTFELKYCLKLVWCFKFWIDNFLRNSIKSSSLINIYGYCFLCLSVTNFICKLNIADNKPKSRNLTSVTQVIHGKGPVEAQCFCFQTCWYLILNSDRKTCTSVVQIMMLLCKNAWSQFQSNTHTDAQIIRKKRFLILKKMVIHTHRMEMRRNTYRMRQQLAWYYTVFFWCSILSVSYFNRYIDWLATSKMLLYLMTLRTVH